jgi:hypothetical protein
MSTQPGDKTIVMPPPARDAAAPGPSFTPAPGPQAGPDPAAVQEAWYAHTYEQNPATLSPAGREAYGQLQAAGWPRPQAPVPAPKDDRSSWPVALADGMAVGALITSLCGFSVIGIILGAIHMSNAHKQRERASAVGCWGLGLGIASLAAEIILLIVFIAAIASVGSAASYSAGF